MSEILPGGAPLPPGGGYGYDDVDEGTNRRGLLIGGGIAAAVLVVIVAFLLLHGGGGNDQTGLVPNAHTAPPVVSSPSATSTSGPGGNHGSKGHSAGTKLPRKSTTRLARDPFKVLFNNAGEATTGTATGAPVTTTEVTPGPTSSTGTVVVPTAPSEGGTPSAGTGGVTTHGDPIWIELVSTNGVKTATFNVGYQDHKFRRFTVSAPDPGSVQGTIFDNEFSLLSIQGNEVTIQVGDDTPFDLRKGVSHQLV